MTVWYWKPKCLSVPSIEGKQWPAEPLRAGPGQLSASLASRARAHLHTGRASRVPCRRIKKTKPWLTEYSKITKSKQIEQITLKGWMRWRQASSESFVKERSQNNNRNNIWIAELGPLRKMSAHLILLGSFIKTSTENYFYAFPEGEKWISPNKSNIASIKHWALL